MRGAFRGAVPIMLAAAGCSLVLDPPEFDGCLPADAPVCDGDRLVVCEEGFRVHHACENGCEPAYAACRGECANGRVEPGEQCDDGNLISGDGCDASCTEALDRLLTTTTQGEQDGPAIAAGRDGFLLVFEDQSGFAPDSSDKGIRAQLLDHFGVPIGTDFVINRTSDGEQHDPRVASSTVGSTNYFVVWADVNQTDIFGSVRAPNGAVVRDEFQIPESRVGVQEEPVVAVTRDQRFLVVWELNAREIRGRVFDGTGAPLTAELSIAGGGDDTPRVDPAVAFDGQSRFLVVWQMGPNGIVGRWVSVEGTLGNEVQILVAGGDRREPAVVLGSGSMLVVWTEGVDRSISGRLVDIKDSLLTPYAPIGPGVTDHVQRKCAVAASPEGHFVVVWQDEDNEEAADIRARRVELDGALNDNPIEMINTITDLDQDDVAIAMGSRGRMIIWGNDFGYGGDTSSHSVRGRFSPYVGIQPQ